MNIGGRYYVDKRGFKYRVDEEGNKIPVDSPDNSTPAVEEFSTEKPLIDSPELDSVDEIEEE